MMEKKDMTRRTALKIMGSAALATVMATTGASVLTSCIEKRKKRVVLYFTGTGNCLYVARQLAGKEGETMSIPQLMRKKQFEIEADEIGLVYPVYGHMPPYCRFHGRKATPAARFRRSPCQQFPAHVVER